MLKNWLNDVFDFIDWKYFYLGMIIGGVLGFCIVLYLFSWFLSLGN